MRLSLRELADKIKINYIPFDEKTEIELTLKSMELSRIRNKNLEELELRTKQQ